MSQRSYIALPPGRERRDVLRALPLLSERTVVTSDQVAALGDIAWGQLGPADDAPGLLVHRAGWEPDVLYALTAVSRAFGAARTYDRATFEHGFAAAWAGVRLEERHAGLGGDGEADVRELEEFIAAAAGISRLLLYPRAPVPTEVVEYAPVTFRGPREYTRIVAGDAPALDGWERFAGDGFVLLERAGPEDPELTRSLGGSSLWCAEGGAVRWIHDGEAGEGNGWRAAVEAWRRPAAALGLTPAELGPSTR